MIFSTILPGATIGILGGGQIGQMAAQAAISMGYKVAIFDPDPYSPAGLIAHYHFKADYNDFLALTEFAKLCDAVSTEFENIPAKSLAVVEKYSQVSPSNQAVALAQDRRLEKQFFSQHNIDCVNYHFIEQTTDLIDVPNDIFPAILKTAKLGYDGKGQLKVANKEQLILAWQELQQVPCILEQVVNLSAEFSTIIARNASGEIVNLPIQQNHHNNGILAATLVDEQLINNDLQQQLISTTAKIAQQLNYVGVLCVEYFLTNNQQLLANEIAPRPHNSGHHSINSCDNSQFALQIKTMTNLPLVKPRLHSPCVMLNLLGDLWLNNNSATPITPEWDKVLKVNGVHLHLYGKSQARIGRKMGHITITANDLTTAKANAQQIIKLLNLPLNLI